MSVKMHYTHKENFSSGKRTVDGEINFSQLKIILDGQTKLFTTEQNLLQPKIPFHNQRKLWTATPNQEKLCMPNQTFHTELKEATMEGRILGIKNSHLRIKVDFG
jgi:hypothetical protein